MPSGNGVAACALQRLGHLLGEFRYLQAAERSLEIVLPHPVAIFRFLLQFIDRTGAIACPPANCYSSRSDAEALGEWERCVA